jgi:serine/threonine protein kinase/WD40 repeat protein
MASFLTLGESMSDSDVFNELAHEFAERFRRGERPSLTEYTDLYPQLADEIRDLFPTLVMMEQLGSGADRDSDRVTGSFPQGRSIPERLGDFRIIREIGRGGMGIVYEAEQESLGRHVALKVLSHTRHLGPIQLIRFQREAKAAALLHHTNIVPVFGVGIHEDVHYYAMQYIQGQGLDAVLREMIRLRGEVVQEPSMPHVEPNSISVSLASGLLRNRFPVDPAMQGASARVPSAAARPGASSEGTAPKGDAVSLPVEGSSSSSSILGHKETTYFRSVARLGRQAAEALAYAHSHGVVHRDIKPANLLLDLQGTIWVTDFGLAKAEGSDELTSPGEVVGTLRYMAPERFQGKADARCDVYSLGLTLYEMLTLEPAFTGSHRAQLINSILSLEPAPPRKLDRHIPRDLETIILKAVAKNPSDRFSTAAEMARELGRFVDGRPIHSRRASVPERLWRWSRRYPEVALLSLLAATLTLVLAIGSTVAAWKFHEQRDQVLDQRDSLRKEQKKTQLELARSLLQQVRAERYSRQPGPRAQRLERLAQAAQLARAGMARPSLLTDLRGEAIATLGDSNVRPSKTWPGLNLSPAVSSFSFDADRYVVVEGGHTFHLHRISDRSQLRVVKTNRAGSLVEPELDPSGHFVYVRSDPSKIDLWDLDRGEVPGVWPSDVCDVAYRPDGGQIAALRPDGEIRVYDLPAMTEARRLHLGSRFVARVEYSRLALSRDGRSLAVMRGETQDAWVYDLTSGRVMIHVKVPRVYRTGGLALNRKATLLAAANDHTISVYALDDGERLAMLQGHQEGWIHAYFEPEGNLLISECRDRVIRVWDPIRGQLLAAFPGHFRGLLGTRSKIVVGQRDDLTLYELDPGDERRTIDCRTLRERADSAVWGPEGLAFSPDGSMIALAMRPDGVYIVRPSDGVVLAHLPIGRCNAVQFLPDGSLLTHNGQGLCRWPVRSSGDGVLRIGPAEPLALNYSGYPPIGLAHSASGRLVGASTDRRQGSLLMDLERPWRRTWLRPHAGVYDVAISPDGKWAATAAWEGGSGREQVKVWDTATGLISRVIPGTACVAFSPDGQWMGIDDRTSYRFFRIGTWAPVSKVDYAVDKSPGQGTMPIAFHPGGKIAAVLAADRTTVLLVDVQSGHRLTAIDGPSESQVYRLVFSPDGRFLAVTRNSQKVDLWNLPSIRLRLQEMGLVSGFTDSFGTPSQAVPLASIERIEVRGADPVGLRLLAARQTLNEAACAIRRLFDEDLFDADDLADRGYLWNRLEHWRQAASDFRRSLARNPDSAAVANELAWCLAVAPGRGQADEAVRWARVALEREPNSTFFRNTLGAALYRAGKFAEAAVELERNIAANAPMIGYDWVLLAMCKQKLAEMASAHNFLSRAAGWRPAGVPLTAPQPDDFLVLLREARALLEGPLLDFPPDVFTR